MQDMYVLQVWSGHHGCNCMLLTLVISLLCSFRCDRHE